MKKIKEEPKESKTQKAFYVRKTDHFLAEAVEILIIDGIVVEETVISNPNLPASAVGKATQSIWLNLRGSK